MGSTCGRPPYLIEYADDPCINVALDPAPQRPYALTPCMVKRESNGEVVYTIRFGDYSKNVEKFRIQKATLRGDFEEGDRVYSLVNYKKGSLSFSRGDAGTVQKWNGGIGKPKWTVKFDNGGKWRMFPDQIAKTKPE